MGNLILLGLVVLGWLFGFFVGAYVVAKVWEEEDKRYNNEEE